MTAQPATLSSGGSSRRPARSSAPSTMGLATRATVCASTTRDLLDLVEMAALSRTVARQHPRYGLRLSAR
jgi:hypothetical protein